MNFDESKKFFEAKKAKKFFIKHETYSTYIELIFLKVSDILKHQEKNARLRKMPRKKLASWN